MNKNIILFIMAGLVLSLLFNIQSSYGRETISGILNEESERELIFDLSINLDKFNPQTKEANFKSLWDIEDNKTIEPFQAWVRTYPHTGSFNFNEEWDNGYQEIWQQPQFSHRILKQSFPVNLWPFEEYSMPMFFQVDDDVSLKFTADASKTGEMYEDIEWNVKIVPKESSIEEMESLLPSTQTSKDVVSVFNFEVIISHSQQYIEKHLFFFLLPFIPISGMILHFRLKGLPDIVHIPTYFTIVGICSAMFFQLQEFIPKDLTLIEFLLVGLASSYSFWFWRFIILKRRNQNHPSDIQDATTLLIDRRS